MTRADLNGLRIGICQSGGLSSLTVGKWLAEQGLDTLNLVADIGQADQGAVGDLVSRLESNGMPCAAVDLRDAMAEMCFDLVTYQARYDGGYWNTTGASRAVIVTGLARVMRERGCTVLAHGAVGGGNDQTRFDRYVRAVAPDLGVFAPWRDPTLLARFPGRRAMVEFLTASGLHSGSAGKATHSTDASLAGVSHEDRILESLETPCTVVYPHMSVWPQDAPNDTETVRVRFEAGRAVEINGRAVTPLEAVLRANTIGGRNGIWLVNAVENRINGTKGRGVYEAPGLELLGHCLRQVYQATLEKDAYRLFESLSTFIGRQVYEGRYLDTSTRAARAAMDVIAQQAAGTVEVGLYKGNVYFHGLTGLPRSADTVQQKRFEDGGHHWEDRSLGA